MHEYSDPRDAVALVRSGRLGAYIADYETVSFDTQVCGCIWMRMCARAGVRVRACVCTGMRACVRARG